MKKTRQNGQLKVKEKPKEQNLVDENIRFIVPMPGKSSWYSSKQELAYKKIHPYKAIAADFALEDFQAQFLMQREYLID
jgi:hypothetical protein